MSEESEKSNSPQRRRSSQLSSEVKSEVHDLMSALLDERITDAQRQRLESLVVADAGVAELCLAVMHLSCSLPFHVLRDEMASGVSDRDAEPSLASLMHETLIVPGIRDEDVDEEEATAEFPQGPSGTTAPIAKKWRRTWLWGSAAAIFLVSTIAILSPRRNDPGRNSGSTLDKYGGQNTVQSPGEITVAAIPPAIISATVALDATDPDYVLPGQVLSAGRSVTLSKGAVELTFASGAVAVIRAPARFEVVDQNTIALHDGSMAAHVPFAARGFRINSPGLAVIDRGTDFGVRAVAKTSASETHVFGGSVDVLAVDADGQSISAPIRAVAREAYRHESTNVGPPATVVFAPESFTRDLAAIRQPINLHGTGGGLAPGASDPYWQLVSAPAELNWKPRPAWVISDSGYPDSPSGPEVMWISTDKDRTSVPGGTYVFRTMVDLTGFDPATALVEARATADDWVSDIRVNGVSTGLSTEVAESHDLFVPSTLNIPGTLWRSGINQVDVVVHNKTMAGGGLNATGLQLRWSATGCPVVKRLIAGRTVTK